MSGLTKNESKPAVEGALLVVAAGVAGDRGEDHRRSLQRRAQRLDQTKAVHAGQADVAQDDLRPHALGDGERLLGVARRAHLGAPELHLQAQALERVGIVLDDQDAVAFGEAWHVAVGRLADRVGLDGRQPEDEFAAVTRAFAEALDVAAVQLGDAARQGQADTEPAERSRQRLILLREQLEGVRQELRIDPFAAVLDRDLHRLRGASHGDRDRARLEGELGGVGDQVRQRLRQPAAIAAHEDALVGDVDVETVAAGIELVVTGRDRGLDDALDRHLLAHERDLPLRRARDVDQLLDQMAEPADLALEDLAQPDEDRIGVLERPQNARGVGDRRERVAQLVREHRQELALAPLGQAQLLGALGERLLELLPLMDVDAAADVADGRAVAAEAGHAVVEHPAVFAVMTAQAQVHRERRLRFEAGRADAEAAVEILGMDGAGPAVALQLVRRAAGVGGP